MRGVAGRAIVAAAALTMAGTVVAVAAPADAGTSSTARSAGRWAPAAKATIHPGVTVTMGGVSCVAGLVLADAHRVFLGMPASCSGVTGGDPVDGCSAANDPYGLPVKIQGARHDGKLVYSSFVEMQLRGERRPNRCANDSLTLVKIDRRDVKRTNPSLPVLGGPTKVARGSTAFPDQLTVLLSGAAAQAQATSTTAGGWAHGMMVGGHVDHTSVGSPVVNGSGAAVGMVTLVPFQGAAGETTVSDLSRVLRVLRHTRGFGHVHLVKGTQPYHAAGLPSPLP